MAKNLIVLYGKKSIFERLKANPASIRKVFIEDDFNDTAILNLLTKHRIRTERTPSWKIPRIKSARNVQGIVAKAEPFTYIPYEKLLCEHAANGCSLVFLDGINDPHNLGVIIRTLACLGGFGIIIPAQGACKVNDTAMHVAIGGENYVPVALVEDLSSALLEAKQTGIKIIGSVPDTTVPIIYDLAIPSTVGIVLGSEHEGMHPAIMRLLDEKVYIPTPGADLSLNITIACAIVCIEIMRKSKVHQEDAHTII